MNTNWFFHDVYLYLFNFTFSKRVSSNMFFSNRKFHCCQVECDQHELKSIQVGIIDDNCEIVNLAIFGNMIYSTY